MTIAVAMIVASMGPAAGQDALGDTFTPTVFEVVRADEGGRVIVVGTAEPGATIELLAGGDTVADAIANDRGEWVLPVPFGPEETTYVVRTTTADGRYTYVAERGISGAAAQIGAATPAAPPVEPDVPVGEGGNEAAAAAGDMPDDGGEIGANPVPAAFEIVQILVETRAGIGLSVFIEAEIGGPLIVVVQPGDTLWDLAERYYGSGPLFWRIADANPAIVNPARLQPGDRLIIPPATN